MRVLVAGGQGQVGSALGQVGQELGMDLVALGRTELDITDAASISTAFEKYRPDVLVNAAAYTAVDKAESEAELAYEINENATALLANACVVANIPMLHISTDYVFEGIKEGPYTEADSVNPLAVYAKSKEAGERALRERVERHIILRTSWVFGVHGNNFVKTMVRLAREHDHLEVVADQFGGPSSARGIALALLKVVSLYKSSGDIEWGTYHYCQKPYVSWYQFAQEIIQQARELRLIEHSVSVSAISSTAFPTPVSRPLNSRLDTGALRRAFHIGDSDWRKDVGEVLTSLSNDEI